MFSHEVIAMDVSCISVSVIILMRLPYLILVHPHACLEVRMRYIYALIKDSHDDRRVSCSKFPRFLHVDIGSLDELGRTKVSIVYNMPLVRKKRVIEYACSWGKLLKFLFCKRNCLLLRSPLECTVVLDLAYLTELRKICCHFCYRMLVAETHYVPQMKTFLASLVLCAKVYRENSLDLITVDKIKDLINAENT